MPVSAGEVRLVPFDPARDAGLISTWLHAPHVTCRWGDPEQALAEVLELDASAGPESCEAVDGVTGVQARNNRVVKMVDGGVGSLPKTGRERKCMAHIFTRLADLEEVSLMYQEDEEASS